MAELTIEEQLADVMGRLRELEDERAILQVLYTYAHALDYGYEDEWADVWTEGAFLDWGGLKLRGRDLIVDAFRIHPHAPRVYWKHFLVEPRIDIRGDRATVVSYFARLSKQPDAPKLTSFGRYRDVLVRCADGRWRFHERLAEGEATWPDEPSEIPDEDRQWIAERARRTST